MVEYAKCVCGHYMSIPYGSTQVTCPNCHTTYRVTPPTFPSASPSLVPTGGFWGAPGHSGEGWWFLFGMIIGGLLVWYPSRALLLKAMGMGAEEAKRRIEEATRRLG